MSKIIYRINCPLSWCSISCLKVWNHINVTAAFNETSFSRDLYLTFKSDEMPVKLFVFVLTLGGLLCLELSESVAKAMNLPWNNAEGMRRCVHTFSLGHTWQAVAAPGRAGQPG